MPTKKLSFFTLAEKTLRAAEKPLSPSEIWQESESIRKQYNYHTTGKTPAATIGAYRYTDINTHGDSSTFIQTSKRPARFYLRALEDTLPASKEPTKTPLEKKPEKPPIKERDLHPLLVSFASNQFKAYIKTIYHEKSTRAKKGRNKWLFPDLVGVYYPFKTYDAKVLMLQRQLEVSSLRMYSFELKIELNDANLRESYFQAVSNSSWATEGYLVTLQIETDPSFRDELRRLNNSHGIGVIVLNPENLFESEVLLPSSINPDLDWDTIERIRDVNKDFDDFIESVNEDLSLGKVKSSFDKLLNEAEMEKFLKEKKIGL